MEVLFMDDRKKLILNIIIEEYIRSGQAVASSSIVEKYKLDLSPATVRNEMAELEESGWIMQPYTSAGRIPTEKAYNLFIEALNPEILSKKEEAVLQELSQDETTAKQIAKKLAQLSDLAVIWAFHKHHIYYTGLTNLLQQPEFNHSDLTYDISAIIDRVDEIVGDIFDNVDFNPQILVGRKSPFGPFSSTIISRYKTPRGTGLIGLLGPMRMDYGKNLARVQYLINQLNQV